MFTRVYYKCLANAFTRCTSTPMNVKNQHGTDVSVSGSYIYQGVTDFNSATNNTIKDKKTSNFGAGVAFGNGDTAPTVDDFQLAGEHFTTHVHTVAKTFDPDGCVSSVTYTLTNTGTDAFTIKEVGVFVALYYTCLMYREVLDTPVTIPAGGIGQVTLTFRVNIPES